MSAAPSRAQRLAARAPGLACRALGLAGHLLLALLASLLWSLSAGAQGLQPVPPLQARVTDTTATLTAVQREALERKLADFEARSGPQIVVLLVASTQPEDIAAYAYRVADQWKVGRREVGDGLLLLVAVQDRRVRIEVARALEGAVPDLAARQIIDQAMAPAFRAGDYAGGLNQGLDRLIGRISGEGLPAPATAAAPAAPEPPPLWFWGLLLAVPVAMVVARAVLGPLGGALLIGGVAGLGGAVLISLGAGLVLGLVAGLATLIGVANLLQIVLSSGGGHGGGGGGGGGGFSSGGGGSFGGGGASGSW